MTDTGLIDVGALSDEQVKAELQHYAPGGGLVVPPQEPTDLFTALRRYEDFPPEWRNKCLWDWQDEMRILPVDFAISALFTIGNRKSSRRLFQRQSIPILSQDYEMRYTGPELRQDDELVWMQLLHMGRGTEQPLGTAIQFKAGAFLRAIGKNRGHENYAHLKLSIARLRSATVEIYSKEHKHTRGVGLVANFDYEDENHFPLPAWRVSLDPRLFLLLDGRYHTRLNFERRLLLGNGLAAKLHSYYACHRSPMDRSVDDLFLLCCGDPAQIQQEFLRSRRVKKTAEDSKERAAEYLRTRMKDFRRDLREALERLSSPEIGFLDSFELYQRNTLQKTTMVHVQRAQEPGYNDPNRPKALAA